MKTRFLMIFVLVFFVSFLTQSSFAEQSEQTKVLCEDEYVLVDGICMPKPKPSDFRDLQTGETISNPEVIVIIQSLGAVLIILFIVIYAIRKRRK